MHMTDDLALDPRDIEMRGVLRDDGAHKIRSRIGILASIYFLDGWRQEKRQALLACLTDYLARFGDHVTHYQVDGERRLRRWDGEGIPEPYRNLAEGGEDEPFHYYMLHREPAEDRDPSLWMIMALVHPRTDPRRPLSGLKVHAAPGSVFADPDGFVAMMGRWSEWLGAIHGSAGLGSLSVPGTELPENAYHYPWLMRYPALEYDAMGSYFNEADRSGHERPRSSNWLTILGSENLEALGGLEEVRSQLSPGMDVTAHDGGAVIRACALPALGNAETGGIPDGYRRIARIIRPIRFEGYRWSVIKAPVPGKGAETTLQWIRRFDEPSP